LAAVTNAGQQQQLALCELACPFWQQRGGHRVKTGLASPPRCLRDVRHHEPVSPPAVSGEQRRCRSQLTQIRAGNEISAAVSVNEQSVKLKSSVREQLKNFRVVGRGQQFPAKDPS
jgi:hypothetical protein